MSPDAQPAALITGAGTGIGAATAALLGERGWRCGLVGRRAAPLEEVAARTGGIAMPADVSLASGQIPALLERALKEFGRLDGLVLNAGITSAADLADQDLDSWQTTIDVNLSGPFGLVQAALPALRAARGSVVSVSSLAALRASAGLGAYAASKAGLVMLMQTLAIEVGEAGVRANTVCPGWIETPMSDVEMDVLAGAYDTDRAGAYRKVTEDVPLRRAGSSAEAAAAIAWLLSAEASFVTGATLAVDGGSAVVDVGGLAFKVVAEHGAKD